MYLGWRRKNKDPKIFNEGLPYFGGLFLFVIFPTKIRWKDIPGEVAQVVYEISYTRTVSKSWCVQAISNCRRILQSRQRCDLSINADTHFPPGGRNNELFNKWPVVAKKSGGQMVFIHDPYPWQEQSSNQVVITVEVKF